MSDKNIDEVGPWVDVVFIEDWDAQQEIEISDSEGESKAIEFGDWDKMAEYMEQWDYGDETDGAHTNPVAPWGQEDALIHVTVHGMNYILSANWHLRYASLNRRPLEVY